MRGLTFTLLLLHLCAFSVYAAEDRKNGRGMEADEAAEKYFECRAITASDLKDDKAPRFEDYEIPPEESVKLPKVDTKSTKIGRRFRTVLRDGITSGSNYAGHYAIVVWGCGTSCSSFAVVNLKTGQVITPSSIRSVSGNHLDNTVGQFLSEGLHGSWGYRYRLDSRLLVFVGMMNEDENREGAYYFVMENEQLKPVHETRVIKHCVR